MATMLKLSRRAVAVRQTPHDSPRSLGRALPVEGEVSGLEAGRIKRMMVLECPDCGREAVVDRDPTDPPTAVRARLQCDRCDDGDFHSPEFFDGSGAWANPVEHIP